MTDWEGLTPPYATIVADPPWEYACGFNGWGRRRALPYSAMTLDQIKALPVGSLAAYEGRLFLWATDRHLEAAFDVLRAWGFTRQQTVVWCKEPNGKGLGGMFAPAVEFVLVAQKIKPGTHAHGSRTKRQRLDRNWFQWPRGAHSEKPAAFMDTVERVSPGPYVELFCRQPRFGWDHWGRGYEQEESA